MLQSFIKQQSRYWHWPSDVPKQAVQPSVCWMVRMRSAFFFLPGAMSRALAFSFISGIFMDLAGVLTVGISSLLKTPN